MNDEREIKRHNNVVELINSANSLEELPNIKFSSIASYLAANVSFNGIKISQTEFKPVIDELIAYGFFAHDRVKDKFFKVVQDNFQNVTDEEINECYNKINASKRIGFLIQEIGLKNEKADLINKKNALEKHKEVLKDINEAFEISDLPKVGLTELNRELLKCVNDNDFYNLFKANDIKELTAAYLMKDNYESIKKIISKLCLNVVPLESDRNTMEDQIFGALIINDNIEHIVDEIKLKEERKLFIYKNNHEETMEQIKEADRISRLPRGLTTSALTQYLCGNSTIISGDNRITAKDLKDITVLLLEGHTWDEDVVKKAVNDLALSFYPDNSDAFKSLYDKLSMLPRTNYLVEEINASNKKQEELINRRCSNVNVYLIPNEKSDGGRFYNVYINRQDNLDLNGILPLNLDEIIPPDMDTDSIEWFIKENYDDTFKAAGGIILNKDETVGNISVFKPNDGTVGVSPEEKSKMDKIESLDKEIQEKENELLELNRTIEQNQAKASDFNKKLNDILNEYEKQALVLQKNFIESLNNIRTSINSDENEVGKGLK
jgi:hypothetical protein